MKCTNFVLSTVVLLGGFFSSLGALADVNPGQSIQAAINATPAGGTVIVNAGTYSGTLYPKSGVTLRANGRVVLTGTHEDGILVLNGVSNFVFDGFVLDGTNLVPWYGARFNNSGGNLFQNLEITSLRHQSISVAAGSNGNQFINLDIHHTGKGNCYKPGGYCHGLYVSSDDNVMDGIRSHDNDGHGIQIYSAPENNAGVPDRNTIRNSEAWGNYIGWGVYGGSNNRIESTSAHHNSEFGIRQGGVNTVISNTILCDNGENFLAVGGSWSGSGNNFNSPCSGSPTPPTPIPPTTTVPPPRNLVIAENEEPETEEQRVYMSESEPSFDLMPWVIGLGVVLVVPVLFKAR